MARKSSPEDLPAPRSPRARRPPAEPPAEFELPEVEPIPFRSVQMDAVEATMKARLKKTPVFPFPPELPERHRPYWIELVNSFKEGSFTQGDVPLLKLYCRCAHDVERCNQLIEEEGDVIMGSKGPMVNPRVKVRSTSESTMLNLATKLRAQPASRGNSTEFQRGAAKEGNRQAGDRTIEDDEDDLLGSAEIRGSSHGATLN